MILVLAGDCRAGVWFNLVRLQCIQWQFQSYFERYNFILIAIAHRSQQLSGHIRMTLQITVQFIGAT